MIWHWTITSSTTAVSFPNSDCLCFKQLFGHTAMAFLNYQIIFPPLHLAINDYFVQLEGLYETCNFCKPATKKSLSSNNQKVLSSCNQKMSVHVLQQPKNVWTCTPTTKNSCPHVTKKCLNMYYYNQKSLSFNYKKT